MIYTAQAFIRLPGKRWVQAMEQARLQLPRDAYKNGNVLECKKGDITIRSLGGTVIDNGTELGYEYVLCDLRTRKVVIAVYVGSHSKKLKAPKRFDNLLFPQVKPTEVYRDDRAFLVVPASNGIERGWVLLPTGNDAHGTYGAAAPPPYIGKLLHEARG